MAINFGRHNVKAQRICNESPTVSVSRVRPAGFWGKFPAHRRASTSFQVGKALLKKPATQLEIFGLAIQTSASPETISRRTMPLVEAFAALNLA